MAYTQIDFAKMAAPNVIEPMDYEIILAALKADLLARNPDLNALQLESSVEAQLLEVCAYRELLIRQRINDGAHAVMLAYAAGGDLDQIGANFGVARLTITPANPNTVPPTAAVLEADNPFRERIRLSLYSRTSAGPANQYLYFARSADADVLDASVISPVPGDVLITVLSHSNGGIAPQAVLDAVLTTCNADDVRPLTDHVMVQAATLLPYSIDVALTLYPTGDAVTLQAAALAAVQAYADQHHALGHDITRAGLIAAATVASVQNVNLIAPATDIVVGDEQASSVTGINVSVAGVAV
jgi:phage-related baseplate assembly protein